MGVGEMEESVAEGYKRTEVGVVPVEWEVALIGDQFDIQLGKRVDAAKQSGTWEKCIGVASVSWGKIDASKAASFQFTEQEKRIYALETGDVLLCEGGEIGRCAVWSLASTDYYYQNTLHRLTPTQAYSGSLFTALMKRYIDNGSITGFIGQTSIAHLTKEKLLGIPIAVPPEKEQTAIATALSDVDALLASLDAVLAKRRAVKRAVMQRLLSGEERLPGFGGKWVVRRLGEVLTVCHGRSQREVETNDGVNPILASGGEIGRTNASLHSGPSVLIGRKGTIDKPQYIDRPFWTVDTLFYTEISETAHAKFLYYSFTMVPWSTYNEASGVPSLNARTIESVELPLPHLPEQRAIAAVLSDLDASIGAVAARRAKVAAVKAGMMGDLLTGRVRLNKQQC